jgi:hypothetical protein
MKKILIPLFLIFFVFQMDIVAQNSNAMYFMWGVPQSVRLNPALNPVSNFSMGLDYSFKFSNNFLDLNSVMQYDTELDSTVLISGSREMQADFLDGLGKISSLSTQFKGNAHTAFRINNLYLGFEINMGNINTSLNFPKDLFDFFINGNIENTEFDLTGIGVRSFSYNDIATRISYDFTDALTIGIRTKLLFGIHYFDMTKSDISANLSQDEWSYDLDLNVNMSFPAPLGQLDSFGIAEELTGNFNFESNDIEFAQDYRDFLNNRGFAFDLGGKYTLNDQLELSASIIDIGYINWKDNVYNISITDQVSFTGMPVDNDSLDFDTYIEDSLLNALEPEYTNNAFKAWLPTSVYMGVKFSPTRYLDLGFLSKNTISLGVIEPSFTASANLHLFKRTFAVNLAYSYDNRNFQNLSFGFHKRFLPLPINLIPYPIYTYLLFDNLPLSYAKLNDVPYVRIPHKMRAFSISGGILIQLGYNKDKRKDKKDEPLFYY